MENESVNSQFGSKPIPKSQNSSWIKKVLVNCPYSGGFWPAPSTTVTLSLSHRAVQTGPLWEKLRSRSLWNKCLPLICSTTSNLSPASLGKNPPTWNGASEPVLSLSFLFPFSYWAVERAIRSQSVHISGFLRWRILIHHCHPTSTAVSSIARMWHRRHKSDTSSPPTTPNKSAE